MGTTIALLGSACSLIGLIWIIVLAFKAGDIIWGVISIFCGIVGLVYGFMNFDRCKVPTIMMMIGIVVSVVGNVVNLGG